MRSSPTAPPLRLAGLLLAAPLLAVLSVACSRPGPAPADVAPPQAVTTMTLATQPWNDEIEALGAAQPAIYPLDLAGATPDDHADLAETLAARLGGLHGVVHAAAHFDGLHPLDHLKPADWQRAIQVNATAPFLLTQACLPLLRESADAAVVFVLDDPARMHKAYWGGYGVSKQALATFAAILHEETDTTPVRVHALLPGPMRTGLRRMAYFGEDTLQQPAPEAAAAAVAFLLGPDALPLRGRTLDLRADG